MSAGSAFKHGRRNNTEFFKKWEKELKDNSVNLHERLQMINGAKTEGCANPSGHICCLGLNDAQVIIPYSAPIELRLKRMRCSDRFQFSLLLCRTAYTNWNTKSTWKHRHYVKVKRKKTITLPSVHKPECCNALKLRDIRKHTFTLGWESPEPGKPVLFVFFSLGHSNFRVFYNCTKMAY